MKKRLLLKLAAHLESGKLNVIFNLGVTRQVTSKGVTGCAVTEATYLWPKLKLKLGENSHTNFFVVRDFFGLSFEQVSHCFTVGNQFSVFGGKKLGPKATPKDVAYNIRAMVEKRKATLVNGEAVAPLPKRKAFGSPFARAL